MKKLFRTIWQAGYPLLIEQGVSLLITLILLILFSSLFYQDSGLAGVSIAGDILTENILLVTGVVSLIATPIFLLMVWKDSKKFGDTTSDTPVNLKDILMCMLGACGTALAGAFMMSMMGMQIGGDTFEQYAAVFDDTAPLAMVAVSLILTPLLEELLFRGLVFRRICRSYGAVWAALFSSLVYALTAGGGAQSIFCFVMGMVYSYAYVNTDRVWVPAVMHMAASTFILLADYIVEEYGLAVVGKEAVTGVIGIIAGVTALVSFVVYMQKFGHEIITKVDDSPKEPEAENAPETAEAVEEVVEAVEQAVEETAEAAEEIAEVIEETSAEDREQ